MIMYGVQDLKVNHQPFEAPEKKKKREGLVTEKKISE